MSTRRAAHTATGLYDGRLLVVGGSNTNGGCLPTYVYLATAETYNVTSNTWTNAGSMAGPRLSHTATLLPSGNVLITGGSDGFAVVGTSEQYDVGTNTDSDGDGYNDGLEVALGQHPFLKWDIMRADINYDGVVNPGDQAKLASVYGTRPAQARVDQVNDKVINVGDQAKTASKVG